MPRYTVLRLVLNNVSSDFVRTLHETMLRHYYDLKAEQAVHGNHPYNYQKEMDEVRAQMNKLQKYLDT